MCCALLASLRLSADYCKAHHVEIWEVERGGTGRLLVAWWDIKRETRQRCRCMQVEAALRLFNQDGGAFAH